MIGREIDYLEGLIAAHIEEDREDEVGRADRAAFDSSAAFERLRRYQSAKHRELMKTYDQLMKMRKDLGDGPAAATAEVGPGVGRSAWMRSSSLAVLKSVLMFPSSCR